VLDPRTGRPAEALASATVLAPTATDADALSTAFFVAGLDAARHYCAHHAEVAALLVTRPRPGQPVQIVTLNLNRKELEAA
jgi:thiamine biosynthesis lipoprotein